MRTINLLNSPAEAIAYFEAKVAFSTGPEEVERMLKWGGENLSIVDARARADFERAHIPGAINLPQDRWELLGALQKDKLNIVYGYSQTCRLAAKAALALASKGCKVIEMEGGFQAWCDLGFRVEGEPFHRFRRVASTWFHGSN